MKKWGLRALSLTAALALLAGFTACGETKNDPTEPVTTEYVAPANADVTEAPSEAVTTEDASTAPDDSSEATTAAPDETSAEEKTTKKDDKTTVTTKAAAAKKPATKAEIVKYFVDAVDYTRNTAKPGYTFIERTLIDDKKVSSKSAFIDAVAPAIIKMMKSLFEKWTEPNVVAQGEDHHMPPSQLTADFTKSATLTESGDYYTIHLVLDDERVAAPPENAEDTKTGKVIYVHTKGAVVDGAKAGGVDIQKFDCLYSGCYIDAKINKKTGVLKEAFYSIACQCDLEAKFGFTVDASIPLNQQKSYTFN